MTEIEITSRYGNRVPSLLRVCREECEGMGCVPIKSDNMEHPWRTLWLEAEAKEPTDDGYHFVKCPYCDGTGRVNWLKTILRIPWWLKKSTKTFWQFTTNKDYRWDHDKSFLSYVWVCFKICFISDLTSLRN